MKYKRDEINELLVDLVEGEASDGLKKDLELVLRNSPAREKNFKALEETRKIVKSIEPVMADMSEAFHANLHAKIMKDVAEQQPHSWGRLWLSEHATWRSFTQSGQWRYVGAAALVVLLAGSVFFSSLRPSLKFESAGIEQKGDMLLSISLEVPEAFADSLLNDRGDEFLMDAMAEKVAGLQEKDASQVMSDLRE